VTIGIAAICQRNNKLYVLVVADRQITSAGSAYEPPTWRRIVPFGFDWSYGSTTLCVQSGDDDAYTEIWSESVRIVKEREINTVKEVAEV